MRDRSEDLRAALARGDLESAQEIARLETVRDPRAPDAWQRLAEIAAVRDDYARARTALAWCLHEAERAGGKAERLDPLLFDDAGTRLKLAQLWASHDGRNRAAVRALYAALERFDWYIRPPEPELGDAPFLERHGGRLKAFEDELAAQEGELTLWSGWVDTFDLQRFRGEFCVSQAGCHDPSNFGPARLIAAYTHAWEHAVLHDRLALLDVFADDGAFHGLRFRIDGRCLSSDVIDSALQLNFIARHCGFERGEARRLLDIGGGWGRLSHRFLEAFPEGAAHVVDVVPFTSFAAEHYLTHRGVIDRAVVGGRSRLDALPAGSFDIAANVHSWSEAPLHSIRSWLDTLDRLRPPFLFFVSHGLPTTTFEKDAESRLIVPEILASGWQLVREEPKYGGSLQRQTWGLYPTAHYFLFART